MEGYCLISVYIHISVYMAEDLFELNACMPFPKAVHCQLHNKVHRVYIELVQQLCLLICTTLKHTKRRLQAI